jgi:hypothetical protein
VILGEEHIPQSQFLGFDLEILHYRWVGAESFLGGPAELLAKNGVGGYTFFVDEFLDLLQR